MGEADTAPRKDATKTDYAVRVYSSDHDNNMRP